MQTNKIADLDDLEEEFNNIGKKIFPNLVLSEEQDLIIETNNNVKKDKEVYCS